MKIDERFTMKNIMKIEPDSSSTFPISFIAGIRCPADNCGPNRV